MDDTCAVCADTLEWVAYGACGHRDVCSTCVTRLRVICGDRRCCICKTECPFVFVTKALGDYTQTITDFSVFPSKPREGQVKSYWYNEDIGAYFDDVVHYKMVKAMCKLSCCVCDKLEEEAGNGPKRQARIKNIEQLKGHLFHRHQLIMCSLCLEGRKVFICEQKLYTRAQLNQHIKTGDSEVDGDETERGGFTGHPMCEFCKSPFYGDNELYTHMSRDHYTCHICQRRHPGQYEYYKNYDDLEVHFLREHFLCEDEDCLGKKFVVFQNESEMKRHNTLEHGGHMSRAKRSAALRIPSSFRYRRSDEQNPRRGRSQTFHRDQSDDQLYIAIQASLETAHTEGTSRDQSSSSGVHSVIQPLDALAVTDAETSARYCQALDHGSGSVLQESLFPPLPVAPSSSQQKGKQPKGSPSNSMAAHLRRQKIKKVNASSSSSPWPAAAGHGNLSSYSPHWPAVNSSSVTSRSSATVNSQAASSSAYWAQNISPEISRHPSGSSRSLGIKVIHAPSTMAVSVSGSSTPSISDFTPVFATQVHRTHANVQALPKVEDIHAANKPLVEQIRAALKNDEDKFSVFRAISGKYRQGTMDTNEYLDYVQQFGLSHLVMDMARLCPDAQKQKELVEFYKVSLMRNGMQENSWNHGTSSGRDRNGSKKGKGIAVENGSSSERLADNIISTVRALQTNYNPVEDVEILSKDGYRSAKGKTVVKTESSSSSANDESKQNGKVGGAGKKQRKKTSKFHRMRIGDGSAAAYLDLRNSDPDPDPEPDPDPSDNKVRSSNENGGLSSANDESKQNGKDGGAGKKQRKKTSKFHRMRLGDGSAAAYLDLRNSDPNPEPDPDPSDNKVSSSNENGGLPVRGVWKKGSAKLFL